MSEELRPCPFCGEMNILSRDLREEIEYFGCVHTQLMERDLWNSRPIEDALRKQLDIAKTAANNILWTFDEAIRKDDSQIFNKLAQKLCDIAENMSVEMTRLEQE